MVPEHRLESRNVAGSATVKPVYSIMKTKSLFRQEQKSELHTAALNEAGSQI